MAPRSNADGKHESHERNIPLMDVPMLSCRRPLGVTKFSLQKTITVFSPIPASSTQSTIWPTR